MPAGHVLALDQGTTSTRAILFRTPDLTPVAVTQQEFAQIYPASGWVNQHAINIWDTTRAVCESAMEQAGKVAIGRFVLRTRQQLCALRPANGVLVLSTMLFGDEVNAPERLDELEGLDEVEANAREVAMAGQLIESL